MIMIYIQDTSLDVENLEMVQLDCNRIGDASVF